MLICRRFLSTRLKSLGPHQTLRSLNRRECSSVLIQKYEKKFNGPDLGYFIAKAQRREIADPVEVEQVPYVSDDDLKGYGRKVYFDVRGCQMNVNDVEVVWSILKSFGYEKTDNLMESNVVLIMTCSIRDGAEEKVRNTIVQLNSSRKKWGLNYKIGILGCMAERLKDKILETEKAVDLVAGPDSYKDLPRLLAFLKHDVKAVNVLLSLDETYADVMPVRLNENSVTAYVSIMRGCDNMCSYCIVPFTRGREKSRPITSILDEVQMLSDQGVKEITLLGQNVNSYRDTSCMNFYGSQSTETINATGFKTVYKPKMGGLRFATLLDRVSLINPEIRIRFTSPHPKDFPDDVLHIINERKNVCNSLHVPAQSGSTAMLEKMKRGYTREAYIELIDHIRKTLRNPALTTDIICGFCGESEADHQDTLDLLKYVKYNFVYMFPFSLREKTLAHRRYQDNLSREEKVRRLAEVRNTFRTITEELNSGMVGELQLILVEGKSRKSEELFGKNEGNIKVIIPDTEVRMDISSDVKRSIKPGDFVAVLINKSSSQVLHGIPLYHCNLSTFDNRIRAS